MKSIEELRLLYENEMRDSIAGLNNTRKRMHQYLYLAILLFIVTFVLRSYIDIKWIRIIEVTAGILGSFYILILSQFEYKKLVPHYKEVVVAKIVNLINPEFSYKQDEHILPEEINSSKIFTSTAVKCKGDDMVFGEIGKTPFKFSEVQAMERMKSKEGEESFPTFFHGIFMIAEFNKHINERTFVIPNKFEEVTNIVGAEKKEAKHYGELVKLENPEFEKIFSVYGSSQQESRYVLTPTMMEAIVSIYKKYQYEMFFSFTGENVYCAIRFSKNNAVIKGLFEPSGKITDTDFDEVKDVYHLLKLADTLINEMNLNTRIWTKE